MAADPKRRQKTLAKKTAKRKAKHAADRAVAPPRSPAGSDPENA